MAAPRDCCRISDAEPDADVKDIEVDLEIPLEKVMTGGEETVHPPHSAACGNCRGAEAEAEPRRCAACGDAERRMRAQALTVRIPAGIEEGAVLRIPGRGLPGSSPDRPPGDLLVVIRTAEDPRFQRLGPDLSRLETIGVVEAVLGTTLRIPTLTGTVTIEIPPGTQPDTILRLRGKGLPRSGGGRAGDLFVRLRVRVPDRLSDRQRRLFEQLRTAGPAR